MPAPPEVWGFLLTHAPSFIMGALVALWAWIRRWARRLRNAARAAPLYDAIHKRLDTVEKEWEAQRKQDLRELSEWREELARRIGHIEGRLGIEPPSPPPRRRRISQVVAVQHHDLKVDAGDLGAVPNEIHDKEPSE